AMGCIEIWEFQKSSSSLSFKTDSPLHRIMFAMNFRLLNSNENIHAAGGNMIGSVIVWDVKSGKLLAECNGHEGVIFRVKWFDDETICTVADDRTVRLWKKDVNLLTFTQKWSSFGHKSRIWDCDFINGKVITVGEDATAR